MARDDHVLGVPSRSSWRGRAAERRRRTSHEGVGGLTFLAFGLALHRAEVFAPAIRWTFIVAGAVATVIGAMMFAGIGDAATFWLFRVAGLLETLALFWVAGQLYRGTSGVEEAPEGVRATTTRTPSPATP